ncbi:hypothetical protein GQ600_20589 [Phytophthora cactorum]|nr:hypothetical protein GQ600_20589 [Phytophthora cactorum]
MTHSASKEASRKLQGAKCRSSLSKYARYKRTTAFFLDWLLRARGRGRHAGQRVELETLSDVVKEIAAAPRRLRRSCCKSCPRLSQPVNAPSHCENTWPQDDRAQRGHQHFLGLLKDWHMTLKVVGQEAAAETESTRFENYYEVLQVDEDYFPE